MAKPPPIPRYVPQVSHVRAAGSLAGRSLWFQSLTETERLQWLAAHQKLAWDMNGGRMPERLHEASSRFPHSSRVEVIEFLSSEFSAPEQ